MMTISCIQKVHMSPDRELNEDEYHHEQVEDTPEEDDNSFDIVHQEAEATQCGTI